LLFVGIKLFFLTPPQRAGIQVIPDALATPHNSSTPVIQEPDFALAEMETVPGEFANVEPEKLETTDVAIVLAGPLSQSGSARASSSPAAAKTDVKRQTTASTGKAQQKPSQPANAAGAKSKWGVQIGAFVNEGSASTLLSDVNRLGYVASISKIDSSGKTFHRVRVGAGNTREDANRLAAELEQKGYPVAVVPML
jgi:cell division septation protein DedD